ncbi:MAG: hypothetical protein CMJ75_19045 [Planctomycetaceae bacterium]|nr:hypothetical protein [Planctomycetaceae bacterium]
MTKNDLPLFHSLSGMVFRVVAEFPHTPEGEKQANNYMQTTNYAGLLDIVGDRLLIADGRERGRMMGSPKPVPLLCTCCGARMIGRQFHNQDTGFGLCNDCVDYCAERSTSSEQFQQTYGLRGVHYEVPQP